VKVTIKDFDVAMEIKNNGVELKVSDTNDAHLGDLIVTKTKLVWCKGRTKRENGKTITWPEFIKIMEAR
jgi:hypothetical protein